MSGPDRRAHPEEDRLPWLEERPRERSGGSGGRIMILLFAVALLAAAVVAAMRFWPAGGDGMAGEAELVRAPAGPYKVRPADPGGMSVEGEGSSAYVASEGGDPRGAIDLSAVPEAPLARHAAPASTPIPAPAATVALAALADPAGASIQLGAFSTEAKANAAWKAMVQRFAFLAPLTPVILPAKSGDATVYRLRAPAGVNARAMCGRLKVAGETCLVMP